ncbi:FkbM family methyltransferase [Breoghania sp.]|uniref:FkbM family methyltransferase n=1 Tax=Breoghania sp. TaxID=2065378 RepID=UPI002AA90CF3|nr:FkbM family methyltransferase [Breoghania sp.]
MIFSDKGTIENRVPPKRHKPLIFHVRRLLRPKSITIHGIRLCCDPKLVGRREMRRLFRGNHENAEVYALRHTLEADDRVLELGAGVGLTSIFASRIVGPENITVFEANEANRPLIEKNYALNGVSIPVHYKMVTHEGGKKPFFVSDKAVSSGPVEASGATKKIELDSVAISDLIADYSPTYLICDIEGGEIEVLQGDLGSIRKICVEVHPAKVGNYAVTGLMKTLIDQGFTLAAEISNGTNQFWFR